MTAAAEMLRENRQINLAVGAAAEADALAAQIEQRDDGAGLTLVEMRRDFAAVAEAARRPHRYAVVELAIDHRGLRQFEAAAHRILPRLEGVAQLAAHPRLVQFQDFAIRSDSAEGLYGQRPVGRLGDFMDPTIVIVGDHDERLEGVELGALLLGLVAGQPLEKIEREARRRVLFA